ncbi:MAG: hypothetical protein RR185_03975, partial [Angelakisella sp.]
RLEAGGGKWIELARQNGGGLTVCDMEEYKLKAGIVKACAGLLQSCDAPWVQAAAAQAEQVIGQDYATNDTAQQNRKQLVQMVKLNLINRKEYDRELLNRQFRLQIRKDTLTQEKRRFCYEFARQLHLL